MVRSFVITAFFTFASYVNAGFITETASTSGLTNYDNTLSVAKFNSSLGNLRDVVISYTDNANVSGSITNTSRGAANFAITEVINFDLSLSGTTLLSNSLTMQQDYSDVTSRSKMNFAFSPTGSSGVDTLTSGLLFSDFIGTGDVSFLFGADANTRLVGTGGNDIFNINTTAGSTLTVRYDFTDSLGTVPEPSSIFLCTIATSLTVLAFFIRHKCG